MATLLVWVSRSLTCIALQVPQVVLEGSSGAHSLSRLVDLHLTPHHTILSHASSHDEIWVAHSLLLSLHLHAPSRDPQARTPLVIRTRTYESYRILFNKKQDAKAVYESLEAVLTRRGQLASSGRYKRARY